MSDTRFALIVLAAAAALTFSASPDLHAQQAFAAGILDFIFSWNELSIALLTQRDTATVPVAIARFAQQYETQHGQMAAASVIATLPALPLMAIGQRFIVRGLTAGAR